MAIVLPGSFTKSVCKMWVKDRPSRQGDRRRMVGVDTIAISIVVCYIFLMRYTLKTNNTIAYNCHYHVVFCPKYRRKVVGLTH